MRIDEHPFVDSILDAFALRMQDLNDFGKEMFLEILTCLSRGPDSLYGVRYDYDGLDDLLEVYDIYQVVEDEIVFPVGRTVMHKGEYLCPFRMGRYKGRLYVLGVLMKGYTLPVEGEDFGDISITGTFVQEFGKCKEILKGCMLVEKTGNLMG